MNIAVVGLGHIGLPLAAQYASKGHRVLGCDINPAVVEMINAGRAYPGEDGLAERVAEAVAAGRLTAETTTSRAVAEADAVVVIVPLVVDRAASIDYRTIDAATRDVAAGLRPGTLVVYETTLPVGDTRARFGPMLEAGSGLRMGDGFGLVFSPERVFVGRVFEDLRRYPKVVGGIDDASTRQGVAFYEAVLDAEILDVGSAETAEFTKLAETTYRDVNIALANEFAKFADERGVDALRAIGAANTQPYSHIHRPGVGVGGHCIPVYPYFYANNTAFADLARLARQVNDGMADYAVARLALALDGLEAKGVAVFGLAYRGDVKEDAFSVAGRLVAALEAQGAQVWVHDPLYADDELRSRGLRPYRLDDADPIDAVIIQAGHVAYHDLDWSRLPGLRVLLDGRSVLDASGLPDSVRYIAIGQPPPGGDRKDSPVARTGLSATEVAR